MSVTPRSVLFAGLMVLLLLLVGLAPAVVAAGPPPGKGPGKAPWTVDVQILAVNDVEGNISTGRQVGGRPVGGDGFIVLTDGANEVFGVNDLDALTEYVQQLPQPFDSEIEGRINLIP